MADIIEVLVPRPVAVVEVIEKGPKGDRGEQGEQGPVGAAQAYRFTQASPSALWTINHNLGRRPVLQLETPGGLMMMGGIVHLSDNITQIVFDEPTAGAAVYI